MTAARMTAASRAGGRKKSDGRRSAACPGPLVLVAGSKKKYMKNIMIDLETLGTTADSMILSIGAVKFDLESDAIDEDGFYASVSIDSNKEAGRQFSEATLIWWIQQSAAAQAVFLEPKQTLESALCSLVDWFGHNKRKVWSNGASFDIPMLEHAYAGMGMEAPWSFWNSRCVRTYRDMPGHNVAKSNNNHNALKDAINQAREVQAIHAAVFNRKRVAA